MLIFTEGMC